MNNTTTRTLALVAVFMAATLVVGTLAATTTTTTTQSTAYAYSPKKDNRKDGNAIWYGELHQERTKDIEAEML
jgi:hypothetical protein